MNFSEGGKKLWLKARKLVDFTEWNTAFHQGQTKFLIWFKEGSGYVPVILFRKYSAFSLVIAAATLVSLTNYIQEVGGLDRLSAIFGIELGAERRIIPRKAAQESKQHNLSLVSLATPPLAADLSAKTDTSVLDEAYLSPENQMFLASAMSAQSARDPEEEGGVKIYLVKPGDTVSGIAAANGITVNTILWANDLDNVDEIKPGDQIFILPVAGFNYVIKTGDTLDGIASKYKADRSQIISFNGLPANGELTIGEEIVIPGGVKETPAATPSSTGLARREYASQTGGGAATDITPNFSRPKEGKIGQGHRFPYGYCTWFVAQKRYVPWGGNAGTWLYNARAYGYKTGKTPAVGSIVVTTENRYYGHVAYVERVTADAIFVSEMNYTGWAKKSTRQLSRASRVIKGYVY
ncbi:MAG: LysM peptidoglycan-binding domain-containing protein [Undibacterium sp.]